MISTKHRKVLALLTCLWALGINAHAQSFLTNGLVAHYPLNGSPSDASGNGNDGVTYGAVPTTDRFGVSGGCFSFDGNGQYISAPADRLPTTNRTISLWFKANRSDNRPVFLGYGGSSCGDSFFLGLNLKGEKVYWVSTHCDVYSLLAPYTNAPVGWHHFLVVTDENGTRLYLDSQLIGSRGGVTQTYVTGTQLGLGTVSSPSGNTPYQDENSDYLDGYLDDVRIYNRALSFEEIKQINSYESGDSCPPAATLTYHASLGTLPSAQGWTNVDSSLPESNYSILGGSLLQGDTSPDGNLQYYSSSGIRFDFDHDTVLETARLKVISSGLSHPPDPDGLGYRRAGWGIQTFDNQGRFVTLFVGSGGFFLLGKNDESSGVIGFDTTTAFHDYALTLNSSGASLTVDGTPMASLTLAQFRTSAMTNAPSMNIGDVSIAHSSSSRLSSFSICVAAKTPPLLNVTMQGVQQVEIAWNTNHTGYVLESASTLPTANWELVTNSVVMTGQQFSVAVGAGEARRFFRLRKN